MSTGVARDLGVLAERLVTMKPREMTRALLDEIIITLRAGEKEIVNLHDDARRGAHYRLSRQEKF